MNCTNTSHVGSIRVALVTIAALGYFDIRTSDAQVHPAPAIQVPEELPITTPVPGPNDDSLFEVRTRLNNARLMLKDHRFDEAAGEFIWLWNNIPTRAPALTGVRSSFMAKDMRTLVLHNHRAREYFETVKRDAKRIVDDSARNDNMESEALLDWFTMCEVFASQHEMLLYVRATLQDANRGACYRAITSDRLRSYIDIALSLSGSSEELAQLYDCVDDKIRFEHNRLQSSLLSLPADSDHVVRVLVWDVYERARHRVALMCVGLVRSNRAEEAADASRGWMACDDSVDAIVCISRELRNAGLITTAMTDVLAGHASRSERVCAELVATWSADGLK